MAQKRGADGGDGLLRGRWGGSLQSESPSDSAGRQTGFLIGEPIGQELTRNVSATTPNAAALAINSWSNCNCFAVSSAAKLAKPITFAPGRLRLATRTRRMSFSQCTNYRWRTAAKGHSLQIVAR